MATKKREGLNRIRDLVLNDLSSGIHGTDGTDPSLTNPGPGSGVEATRSSDFNTGTGSQTFNVEHIVLTTVANGETLKEYALQMNSDNVTLTHVVYPDFEKTNSLELHTISTVRFE